MLVRVRLASVIQHSFNPSGARRPCHSTLIQPKRGAARRSRGAVGWSMSACVLRTAHPNQSPPGLQFGWWFEVWYMGRCVKSTIQGTVARFATALCLYGNTVSDSNN